MECSGNSIGVSKAFRVTLPDQQHNYFVTQNEEASLKSCSVTSISFRYKYDLFSVRTRKFFIFYFILAILHMFLKLLLFWDAKHYLAHCFHHAFVQKIKRNWSTLTLLKSTPSHWITFLWHSNILFSSRCVPLKLSWAQIRLRFVAVSTEPRRKELPATNTLPKFCNSACLYPWPWELSCVRYVETNTKTDPIPISNTDHFEYTDAIFVCTLE